MKVQFKAIAFAAATLVLGHAAWAGEAEAKKWIDSEFQPSTLSKDQQMAEMKWFIEAAKKLQAKGVKEISVVSETITTHEYEAKTLAKAFTEITGITVKHDLIQEGDVVEKLQTSMQSGKSIYDGWISDSDLIGTHYRYGKILTLTGTPANKLEAETQAVMKPFQPPADGASTRRPFRSPTRCPGRGSRSCRHSRASASS